MKTFLLEVYFIFINLFRRNSVKEIKIPNSLEKGSKILLFVPEEKNLAGVLKKFISKFVNNNDFSVYVFLEEKLTPFYCDILKLKIISYSQKSINKIGFPTSDTLRELKFEKFKIMVDLNILPSTFISFFLLYFNDIINIGFKKEKIINYNIEIKVDDLKNYNYIYTELFKFLTLI